MTIYEKRRKFDEWLFDHAEEVISEIWDEYDKRENPVTEEVIEWYISKKGGPGDMCDYHFFNVIPDFITIFAKEEMFELVEVTREIGKNADTISLLKQFVKEKTEVNPITTDPHICVFAEQKLFKAHKNLNGAFLNPMAFNKKFYHWIVEQGAELNKSYVWGDAWNTSLKHKIRIVKEYIENETKE